KCVCLVAVPCCQRDRRTTLRKAQRLPGGQLINTRYNNDRVAELGRAGRTERIVRGGGGQIPCISGYSRQRQHQQICRHENPGESECIVRQVLPVSTLWKARNMRAVGGNIIATIMTTHVVKNSNAWWPVVVDGAVGMCIPIWVGVQASTA